MAAESSGVGPRRRQNSRVASAAGCGSLLLACDVGSSHLEKIPTRAEAPDELRRLATGVASDHAQNNGSHPEAAATAEEDEAQDPVVSQVGG